MVNSGHGAMLEHGTVYLYLPVDDSNFSELVEKYTKNKYTKVNQKQFITTNYRVLVENEWLDDLQYLCKPTEHHEKRVTVKFICDRGVSHEFVRHRTMSFAQESTRYCNYCKSKFNNELIFIIPEWVQYIDEGDAYWHDGICFRTGASTDNMYMGSRSWTKPQPGDDADTWHIEEMFINSLYRIEVDYKNLITKYKKLTAQQARAVLPNALKTELVMTGFVSDWEHFFKLRCHSTAHPDARALAIPLQDKFIELSYITDESKNN
jgi:thymidylate synthase (FAD)